MTRKDFYKEYLEVSEKLKTDALQNCRDQAGKALLNYSDFKHGDIVRITSYEKNCGIDETTFIALVLESKENGYIAIPQDFRTHIYKQVIAGTSWEMEVEWLLENDVEIELVERYL